MDPLIRFLLAVTLLETYVLHEFTDPSAIRARVFIQYILGLYYYNITQGPSLNY